MPELSPEQVQALTRYMFIDDTTLQADCTLVLGMTLVHRPVARAAQLHERGQAGLIVFSGGPNPRLHTTEALAMHGHWCGLGHSDRQVRLETRSTHTRENMTETRDLLEREGLLKGIRRMNLVTISYHMRRAVETFRDVFGDHIALGTASYPSVHCPPQGWAHDPQGRALVLAEFEKIRQYLPHRLRDAPALDLASPPR